MTVAIEFAKKINDLQLYINSLNIDPNIELAVNINDKNINSYCADNQTFYIGNDIGRKEASLLIIHFLYIDFPVSDEIKADFFKQKFHVFSFWDYFRTQAYFIDELIES